MKKVVFLAFCLVLVQNALACDGCSCSTPASIYLGVVPRFNQHMVSIRQGFKTFNTSFTGHSPSTQRIASTELWLKAVLSSRFQVIGVLPYYRTEVSGGGTPYIVGGIGESSVMARYIPVNMPDSLPNKLKHTLSVGVGLKLASASISITDIHTDTEMAMPVLGTGSTSYLYNITYNARVGNNAIAAELSYTYNTVNRNDELFGDRMLGSIQYARRINFEKIKSLMMPSVTVLYENGRANYTSFSQKIKAIESNGNISWLRVGTDFYWKNIGLGANIMLPLKQNIANSNIYAYPQLGLHFICFFGGKKSDCN